MKPNENDVKIITSIINFMEEHTAPEILYARAIDSTTAVLLRIWLEHETIDMSQQPPHIIDVNAASDEKTFVMNILKYLGEHDTTGMTYSVEEIQDKVEREINKLNYGIFLNFHDYRRNHQEARQKSGLDKKIESIINVQVHENGSVEGGNEEVNEKIPKLGGLIFPNSDG